MRTLTRSAMWTAAAILVVGGIGGEPGAVAVGAEVATEQIVAPDGEQSDFFGLTLALDADTLVVGAQGEDGGSGAAYVFIESGGVWSFQQKLNSASVVEPPSKHELYPSFALHSPGKTPLGVSLVFFSEYRTRAMGPSAVRRVHSSDHRQWNHRGPRPGRLGHPL